MVIPLLVNQDLTPMLSNGTSILCPVLGKAFFYSRVCQRRGCEGEGVKSAGSL